MTQTATQTASTEQAFNVLWTSLNVTAYNAYTQFGQATVYGETDAHELARQVSIRHGHASVHDSVYQGREMAFSYMDGELLTDNR